MRAARVGPTLWGDVRKGSSIALRVVCVLEDFCVEWSASVHYSTMEGRWTRKMSHQIVFPITSLIRPIPPIRPMPLHPSYLTWPSPHHPPGVSAPCSPLVRFCVIASLFAAPNSMPIPPLVPLSQFLPSPICLSHPFLSHLPSSPPPPSPCHLPAPLPDLLRHGGVRVHAHRRQRAVQLAQRQDRDGGEEEVRGGGGGGRRGRASWRRGHGGCSLQGRGYPVSRNSHCL